MMIQEETKEILQSNKIKLIHNSRGYGWEITILSHDVDLLEKLNIEMRRRFECDYSDFKNINSAIQE